MLTTSTIVWIIVICTVMYIWYIIMRLTSHQWNEKKQQAAVAAVAATATEPRVYAKAFRARVPGTIGTWNDRLDGRLGIIIKIVLLIIVAFLLFSSAHVAIDKPWASKGHPVIITIILLLVFLRILLLKKMSKIGGDIKASATLIGGFVVMYYAFFTQNQEARVFLVLLAVLYFIFFISTFWVEETERSHENHHRHHEYEQHLAAAIAAGEPHPHHAHNAHRTLDNSVALAGWTFQLFLLLVFGIWIYANQKVVQADNYLNKHQRHIELAQPAPGQPSGPKVGKSFKWKPRPVVDIMLDSASMTEPVVLWFKKNMYDSVFTTESEDAVTHLKGVPYSVSMGNEHRDENGIHIVWTPFREDHVAVATDSTIGFKLAKMPGNDIIVHVKIQDGVYE